MSAIRAEWLRVAEFSRAADAAALRELARTGTVQPMTQARTAIHIESAVAIPVFIVPSVKRISELHYAPRDPWRARLFGGRLRLVNS